MAGWQSVSCWGLQLRTRRFESVSSLHMDREQVNKRVLLVEDNAGIREPPAELLAMKGHDVLQAGNGREALALLRQRPLPGLILLDLMMPVMDGWAFLAEKERDATLAPIPVVIMSAVAHLRPVPPSAAIVATFEKVFDVRALVALVERYCGSALLVTLAATAEGLAY